MCYIKELTGQTGKIGQMENDLKNKFKTPTLSLFAVSPINVPDHDDTCAYAAFSGGGVHFKFERTHASSP